MLSVDLDRFGRVIRRIIMKENVGMGCLIFTCFESERERLTIKNVKFGSLQLLILKGSILRAKCGELSECAYLGGNPQDCSFDQFALAACELWKMLPPTPF